LAASALPGPCKLAAFSFYPSAIACEDCDQEMSLARRANPRATVTEYRTQHPGPLPDPEEAHHDQHP